MKKLYFLPLVVLILMACQNSNPEPTDPLFKPENAFGGTVPAEAQAVTPEEFKALSTSEGFKIDTLKLRAERQKAAAAQFKADSDEMKLLGANSSAYQKALVEPDATDPTLKILPDGNYELTIEGKAGPFTVVTDGKAAMYRDMLESKKKYFNAANQLKVYTTSYDELPEDLKAGLPLPASLSSATLDSILGARADLGKKLADNPQALSDAKPLLRNRQSRVAPDAKPVNFPAAPNLEEGAGKGIDHEGSCTTPDPNGLYQNFWWRQKFYATSVKSQGKRGSCVAFALTAALETRVALEQSRWVNMSEQYLWGKIASDWDARDYGDGTILPNRAEDFFEQGFKLPLETVWNYNTSRSRVDHSGDEYYSSSCNGYSEYCSNASHQLKLICTSPPGVSTVCGYYMPSLSGSQFKESEPDTIYDWYSIGSLPVDEMRQYLRKGHPMVAGLLVNVGYDNPSSGFITTLSDTKNRGRHAVQVVGFISSADIIAHPNLPPNIKTAASLSGGGYFIVKNSWGYCYGDAGYVYVPVTWAKEYFTQVTVFKSNPNAEFKSTPNAAPTVSITAPSNTSSFPYAQVTTYSANVQDTDSPAASLNVVWTSDLDGQIGTGPSINYGFNSPGLRKITVTVTDDHGATTSASIVVTGVNAAPKVFIDSPLPGDVIWAGSTNVDFKGSSTDGDGIFGELPCTSLVWKSSNSSDTLGTGCAFSAIFATTGIRTISLTGTDSYGLKGYATVTINVTLKPPSGAPVVKITSPIAGKQYPNSSNFIPLFFSNVDPGGTATSQYTVVWSIVPFSGTPKVITPKTCTVLNFTFPCFSPFEYGYGNSPASNLTIKLTVTDPENLTGTDTITITVGVPG
jgi:Papain family cysteine protease